MVYYCNNSNLIPSIEEQQLQQQQEQDSSSAKMTVSLSLTTESCPKSKQINNHNQFQKSKKMASSSFNNHNHNHNHNQMQSSCCESKLAVIDFVILIAVVGAFGFLLFPYVMFTYTKIAEITSLVYYVLEDEICENPIIYGSLGVSIVCVAMAAWAIVMCTTRKCRNPSCRGLWKAAEFDIQLETEECVKNTSSVAKDGIKKGLFELPRDHHRELEAELKKIAPPNGRAVLVFRARCGCSVGRMEVPGPKRVSRKIKK